MDYRIVWFALAALLVTGCNADARACDDAKRRASATWKASVLHAKLAIIRDEDFGREENESCESAALAASKGAVNSRAEAKRTADAATAACKDSGDGPAESKRAWDLCRAVDH